MSIFSELTSKYQALDKRERQVLTIGAIVVTVLLIFNLLYRPLAQAQQELQLANQQDQQLLVWMKQAAMQINSAGPDNTSELRQGRNINQLLNSSAGRFAISISRSQPRDNNQQQIWLDEADFNQLLSWMHQLEANYGIFVTNINLTAADKKGFVRANITFQDTVAGG